MTELQIRPDADPQIVVVAAPGRTTRLVALELSSQLRASGYRVRQLDLERLRQLRGAPASMKPADCLITVGVGEHIAGQIARSVDAPLLALGTAIPVDLGNQLAGASIQVPLCVRMVDGEGITYERTMATLRAADRSEPFLVDTGGVRRWAVESTLSPRLSPSGTMELTVASRLGTALDHDSTGSAVTIDSQARHILVDADVDPVPARLPLRITCVADGPDRVQLPMGATSSWLPPDSPDEEAQRSDPRRSSWGASDVTGRDYNLPVT